VIIGAVQRISVVGSSASGKTAMARALSERLDLPRLELDAVFHQPGWQPKPDDDFRAEVAAFAAGDHWVIDGNYTSHGVAQLVWPRADAVVWLDPSRAVVMARVIRRTLRRVVTREELWNGNREPWSNLYSAKPEKNIIVWAWTRFAHTRSKYEAMLTDGTWSHLEVVRLRSAREADAFLAGLESRR
jgi:adenylate kinase family enzyme